MNDQSNESIPPNPSNDPGPTPSSGTHDAPRETPPASHFFHSLHSAVREGAKDAREAAQKAVPRARSFAAQVGYGLAYGISFSTVFPYTMLERLAPDCVRTGWGDGAKEGRTSGARAAEGIKKQAEPVPPIMDTHTPEPGTAS